MGNALILRALCPVILASLCITYHLYTSSANGQLEIYLFQIASFVR